MNRRILVALPVVFLAATLQAPAAFAQFSNPGQIATPGYKQGQGAKPEKSPREAAPPALPGSHADPTAVTPADRVATDMPPTEALFDSINRGDLPGARDAISRGADLQGSNVLGLTPLELSVDLGRNEISFLLLSLRGGSGYSVAQPPDAKPPSRAERLAATRAEHARQTQLAARPAAKAAPRAPRLFAGNGGAPIAQAGFLGFDSAR